jgi:LacI family transcriptional regulator
MGGTGERRVKSKRQRRILLAMGWYDYRLHKGIEKFAVEHGWHLCPDSTKEKVVPWGWDGDGILAWLGAGDDLADFVVRAKKPTVDFSFRRPELRFPRVLADQTGAARLAADHFLSRGFANFMFYSDRVNWAYEEDGEAFVRFVQKAGHACNWICWERSREYARGPKEWRLRRRWLTAELKKAPKSLALFAASDDHAVEVLEACENLNLVVPEDVSIIGIDNSILAVDAMRTPISSVDINLEQQGYQGAALLNELMNGQSPPSEPIRVPVRGLITRKSSDFVAVPHAGVARSLQFMLKHYHEPITIEDLAKVAAMSLRGFHKTFLQHINRSPGQHLHHMRVERAKQLLAESDHKITAIGIMCGFQSANGFWKAFRQSTGQSPQQYRRKNR